MLSEYVKCIEQLTTPAPPTTQSTSTVTDSTAVESTNLPAGKLNQGYLIHVIEFLLDGQKQNRSLRFFILILIGIPKFDFGN